MRLTAPTNKFASFLMAGLCPTFQYIHVVFWLFILLLAAPVSVSAQSQYRLSPGDEVTIQIYGEEELSGQQQVSSGGTISLSLIGEVKAAGKTIAELESSIRDALSPDYLKHPKISVSFAALRAVTVVGAVQKPGSYPYSDGLRVGNALALAGGLTLFSNEEGFVVRRKGTEGELSRIEADFATLLQPGDTLVVPHQEIQ